MNKKFRDWWILLGVCGLHVLMNVIWLSWDKTPPAWDQAAHIRSVVLTNQWLTGSFWGGFTDLIKSLGGYPPLIYLIGGIWSLIAGVGVMQITLLNSLFLCLAVAGVYVAIKELTDKRAGLITAILFSFIPVIYDISRNFLLDLPLLVWVIWGFYCWVKMMDIQEKANQHLAPTGYFWGWWVCLILASLTKLNGFIYFAPMGLWMGYQNIKRKDTEGWSWMFLAGTIYAVAVGWWWLLNTKNIIGYLTGLAGQGEAATDPMNLLDWVTWIHYFKLMFLHQLSPVITLFMVYGLYVWKGMKLDKNKKVLAALFVVMNYVVFTIIRNKDFRFTLPLLPFAALAVTLAGESLWKKGQTRLSDGQVNQAFTGRILVVLLAVWMGVNFVENSFGWPIKKPVLVTSHTFVLDDINWVNFSDYPVKAPYKSVWPDEEIMKDMTWKAMEKGKQKVLVLVNIEQLNDNVLKLYREMASSQGDNLVEMHSVYETGFKDWDSFDIVLVGDRSMELAPFYATNLEALDDARDYVWSNQDKFGLVKEYLLPNGAKVSLMETKKIPQ